MTTVQTTMSADELQRAARDHLWLHFTRMGGYVEGDLPVIVRGEGCHLEDSKGKRYLDALAGLFAVQIGYSYGDEIGEAAAAQMRELPFYTNWSYAHPRAIELAAEVASLAPGDLNRVFFVSGGSEAVESAWKLARQYHSVRGERRWKAVSRHVAYHGTTMGALSINGIPALRAPFEPLVPGVVNTRNTNRYRRPEGETEEEFTRFLLDDLEETIEQAGPDTVAMVMMEPVQNAGGSFTPPAGYWRGVRRALRPLRHPPVRGRGHHRLRPPRHVVRLGAVRHPARPGHLREGALVGVRVDRRRDRPGRGDGAVPRGTRDLHARDHVRRPSRRLRDRAQEHRDHEARAGDRARPGERRPFARALASLLELPIAGDLRGVGWFYALELVKDKETKETFTRRGVASRSCAASSLREMFRRGLICRADDRGDPVVQISLPLVAGEAEIDELVGILGDVLTEAWERI